MILRQLNELCDKDILLIDPKREPDKAFWYVDISSVDNITKQIATPQKTLGKQASVRARQVIRENDVLVSTTRPNLNAVALVPAEFDGEICSTGFCVLRCGAELDAEYLFSFVQSHLFVKELTELVQGALYPAVTDKQVFAQSIPWVSMEDQRRIAVQLKAKLAAVEQARQAAQAEYDEISLLKTQALSSILSNIEDTCLIGKVAKVQSGFAFKSQQFQMQGIRLLRNTNILPNRVYWNDMACLPLGDADNYPAYALKSGDVLISLDRPIISSGIKVARVAPEDLPAFLVQRVGRFQIDEKRLDADYLYAFLQTQDFINAISGHEQSLGVPHISPSQIEAIKIPLPNLETQKRLATTILEIMKEIDLAKASSASQLADIAILPARLLAEAFGEG